MDLRGVVHLAVALKLSPYDLQPHVQVVYIHPTSLIRSQEPQDPTFVSLLDDMSFQIMFPGLKLNLMLMFSAGNNKSIKANVQWMYKSPE
jgi:hypothetical protein